MFGTDQYFESIESVDDFMSFCDLFFREIGTDRDVGHLPVNEAVKAMGQFLREYKDVPEQPDWEFVAFLIYTGTIRA